MQKRGFGAVLLIVAVVLVIVIAGSAAYYFYTKSQQSAYPPLPTTAGQTQSQTGATIPNQPAAPSGPAMSAPTDTSDQGLQQDSTALNQQFNSLNNDSTNVNQAFNDQPVNLN